MKREPAGGYRPPINPRHQSELPQNLRTGRGRWLFWILIAVVAAGMGVQLYTTRTTQPTVEQVAIRLERQGPRVRQDRHLELQLSGNLEVTDLAVQAAYCVNGWYWATDVTLNLQIVVGTNGQLVRAAELVASGSYDRDLAEAVEKERMGLDARDLTIELLPQSIPARFGAETVEGYLAESALPSSETANRRYVVYAVSRSTSAQFVYVVDLQNADTAAVDRFASEQRLSLGSDDIEVAGNNRVVTVDRDQCNAIIRSVV